MAPFNKSQREKLNKALIKNPNMSDKDLKACDEEIKNYLENENTDDRKLTTPISKMKMTNE